MATRLIYASPADFRAKDAAKIHIMSMCSALADIGLNPTLLGLKAANPEHLKESYYRGDRVRLEEVNVPNIPLLGSIFFALAVCWYAARDHALVYTRHLPTAFVLSLFRTRFILESHCIEEAGYPLLILRRVLASRFLVSIIVISNALAKSIAKYCSCSALSKLAVLPDAAFDIKPNPLKRHDLVRDLQINDVFTVGYCGSFLPGKGADFVLELARALPSIQFIVAGGSASDLNRLLARHPGDNVILAGSLGALDVPSLISLFDVALLPNSPSVLVNNGKEDIGAWTSPMKMFEYMCQGKAIICSRIPVLLEVLEEGATCLTAESGNVSDWSQVVERLRFDGELRRSLGSAARREFVQKYTWDLRAQAVKDIIESSGL